MLNSDYEMDWARVLKLSVDIAKAVNTLHSWVPPIVHRDMKSLNLLVDANWTVVRAPGRRVWATHSLTAIACAESVRLWPVTLYQWRLVELVDAGQAARHVRERPRAWGECCARLTPSSRHSYAYSAPEVYFGDAFTTKADVYSVGIIFWELAMRTLTGEYLMPYSEYPELVFDFQIIIQVAKNEKRPSLPAECPALYRALISRCWAQARDERPEIPQVLKELDAMLAHQRDPANRNVWTALAKPPAPPPE